MRARTLIAATSVVVTLIGVGTAGTVAAIHNSHFTAGVDDLKATWEKDVADGVPAASLKPLRDQLDAQSPPSQWWSATWLNSDHLALIADLRARTDAAWTGALAAAHQDAQAAIDEWAAFVAQQSTWVTPDATAQAQAWPDALGKATTPGAINTLAAQWRAFTGQQRAAVAAAQTAKLNAELADAGGPQAILATATELVAVADSANLDDSGVGRLAGQLQQELNQGVDGTVTAQELVTAVGQLRALVALNNQVNSQVRPLMLSLSQASAEGTPSASTFDAQYKSITAAFRAARTTDTINAVAQQLSTTQAQINAELTAGQCGHAVGDGKVITVSLTWQEMIFYQDGCVVHAAPTTTGRPALPTPSGTFHVFYKTQPFHMISPWPLGSPYYYPPTWVQQVMEFNGGGYFIHDAYWEPVGDYGPGSQFIPSAASHGCIHIPTPDMQWAYGWTPVGTPVIING